MTELFYLLFILGFFTNFIFDIVFAFILGKISTDSLKTLVGIEAFATSITAISLFVVLLNAQGPLLGFAVLLTFIILLANQVKNGFADLFSSEQRYEGVVEVIHGGGGRTFQQYFIKLQDLSKPIRVHISKFQYDRLMSFATLPSPLPVRVIVFYLPNTRLSTKVEIVQIIEES